jgi:hypothetical protein
MKNEENEETATVEKIHWESYLEDKVVDIKPVESSGKWASLLAKGQSMKTEPYMFNKTKKSFQVPLKSERQGGGVKVVLDDIERKMIQKYETKYPKGMTEQEFFEEELGIDLNPSKPRGENFWRDDKRGRVTLTKEGMTLDLKTPMGMLRYKILLANRNLIAPSYDTRRDRATYEFMIVNQGKPTSKKAEMAEIKTKAYQAYAQVISSEASMKGFLRSLGRAIPANHNDAWLKTEIMEILEEGPAKFLRIVNDPMFKGKVFVQEAVEAGAVRRMNENRYVLDNGVELGDLLGAVKYFSDPINQEVRMRVTTQIEMANKR